MKKTVLLMVLIFTAWTTNADDSVNWKEYTGTYVFPVESMVETFDVTIQSDTILTISSYLGEAALTCVEKDRFEFPQYGGVIVFERDEAARIAGCRVSIAMMDMEEIKAEKQ
jgi:hypothetical protein